MAAGSRQMKPTAEQVAGYLAALDELLRQAHDGELFFRPEDRFVDGRVDLAALVCAILEVAAQARGNDRSE